MAETTPDVTTPTAPAAPSPEGVAEATGTTTTSTTAAPASNDFAALKAELAASRDETERVKRYIVGLVTQLQANAAPDPPDDGDRKTKAREALETDPEAFFEQQLNQRMGPVLRELTDKQAPLAREEAGRLASQRGWGDEWKDFAAEVDDFMEKQPSDLKLSPETWFDAFKLVMAKSPRFDEVAVQRAQRKLTAERAAASEGASPGRIGRSGPAPLTEAERRMAKACNMSEDEWRTQKAALERPARDEAFA